MKDTDNRKFTEMLLALAKMYKTEVSKTMVQMYFDALENFTIDDVKLAINMHVKNTESGQYFPKPADIIRNLAGNTDTRAGQAWAKVDKAVRCTGPYQSVVFDDAIIHKILEEMGGWIKLCNLDLEDYKFAAVEFQKRYRGYADRGIADYPKYLCGIAESQNRQDGKQSQAPVLIGDPRKAEQVYLRGGNADRTQNPIEGPRRLNLGSMVSIIENKTSAG